MAELKTTVTSQGKAFMENIAEVNKNLVEDCGELREKNN